MNTSTFDERAASWDDDPKKLERARVVAEAIRETCGDSSGRRVLDLGAGTGLLGMHFVDGGADVSFVDPSSEMRKQVERKLGQREDHASRAVASLDDAGGDYDLIASLMALHHVDDPPATIGDLVARLKPGGCLALCDLEPEDGSFHDPGTTGVHPGFSREQLSQWCQDAGLVEFRYRTVAAVQRESEEGVRHYPLFLMAAHKDA